MLIYIPNSIYLKHTFANIQISILSTCQRPFISLFGNGRIESPYTASQQVFLYS